jgi:RHS repeat-associated protein/uncharacterized repeat protein (TIGR01451 family)
MHARSWRIWKRALTLLALSLSFGDPLEAFSVQSAAVLFAGDYPGPPAFDDHLSISRDALAANLATWQNWKRGAGGNIVELAGNTTAQQFLDAITPFTAGQPKALGNGDFFLLFYFGHGGFYGNDGQGNPANERVPAFNIWEEGLHFPDASVVSDNQLTAKFKTFAPGVYKVFVNISCFSGGFWNGNNPGGLGDLEQVPRTVLMASSIEPLTTLTGNLSPRTWEPLYLRNLILNLARNGRQSLTLAQWHYSSFVPGTVTGFRFDDPGDPAYYAIQTTADQEETLVTDDPGSMDSTAAGAPPALSISEDSLNGTVTVSWPIEYLGARVQQRSTLNPTNWTDVSGSTGTNRLVVVPAGTARFYRLVLTSAPELALGKVGAPNPVNVGGLLTYTMAVTNLGTVTATNVVLVDMLPENLQLVSASVSQGSVSTSDNAIDCALGNLSTGQVAQVTLVVRPTTSGTVSNSATVVSDGTEANWANNHATAFTTVTGSPTNYSITPIAGANGTIYPTNTTLRNAGERQFFSGSPSPGFWVDTWSVDGVIAQAGGSGFVLNNIQSNHVVQVTFRTRQYIIESSAGTNGAVSPSGIRFKDPGDSQSYDATPNPGYAVDSWLLDGVVAQVGGNGFVVSNVQTNHTVLVIFKAGVGPVQYRINGSSGTGGSVSPGGTFLVNAGEDQDFSATLESGFAIDSWYVNGSLIQTNGLNLTLSNIQANAEVYVTFRALGTNQPPGANTIIGGEAPAQASSLQASESGVAISLTEGNLKERYGGPAIKSAFGPTLALTLAYNSYDADGSHAQLDAGLGYGWTHSYSVLLFSQQGQMFRYDGDGRVTKYTRQPDNVTYLSAPGYFETVVSNAPGQFNLTNKEQTVFTFTTNAETSFTLGDAVYRLTRISDRNQNKTTLTYANGNLIAITDTYGRSLNLAYDGSGHLSSVTDPLGRTTRLEYDGTGRQLAAITDPIGNTIHYAYGPFHQLSQKVDRDGRLFTFTYQDGKPIAVADAETQTIFSLTNSSKWATDPAALTNNLLRVYVPATTVKTDGRGNLWNYDYDVNGSVTHIVAPDSTATIYTYDPATVMLAILTDANSHATAYQYDSRGNRTNVTDALGYTTKDTYEPAFSQVTSTTDANGHTTAYQYDSRGNRTNTIDALGKGTSYTYDSHGNVLTVTDRRGYTTTYGYDSAGNRTNIIDALGHATSMNYDAAGNVKSRTDANGHTYTYIYDAFDRLIRETDPLGHAALTAYDGEGNRTVQTDRNGNSTSSTYDDRQRVIAAIDAVGATTTSAYDANGNRTFVTNALGYVTTYQYDTLDRQTNAINPAGDITRTTYDAVGNVLTVTAPNGNVTTQNYDAGNRLIGISDLVGAVVAYTYDGVGNRLTQKDGNNNTTAGTYDALNRMITVTDPMGHASTNYYDAEGNLTMEVDRNGNPNNSAYDAINRRIQTIDALGYTNSTTYDNVNNVVALRDARGNSTTYQYDAANRRVSETYPDGQPPRTFAYDGVGNVLTRTDQKGQVTSYSYDGVNRLTGRAYSGGDPADQFTYDLLGRMLSANRSNWVVTFRYNAADRLITNIQSGHTITYVYDIPNRKRTITYPSGRAITETSDFRARLSRIDDDGSPTPIVQYTYDAADRVVTRTYRNSSVSTFGYNANDWTTSINHQFGANLIAGFAHAYDNEGNKLYENNLADSARSAAYLYDPDYLLTNYAVGTLVGTNVPLPNLEEAWALDPLGNWSGLVSNGVTEVRAHNAANQLTSINVTNVLAYDANGNLQQDPAYGYAYDAENRLTRATRISDARIFGQYQYDALGRRVAKISGSPTATNDTRFYYDGDRSIEERSGADALQATYVYGNGVDEVLVMVRGGNTNYLYQNALGCIVAATSNDTSTVSERYGYEAYGLARITDGSGTTVLSNGWGTPHSSIGEPYLFTGRQLGEENGVYFYRLRYYDPAKGRFLQRDPYGYAGGPNFYQYVNSRPTRDTDAYGTDTDRSNPNDIADVTLPEKAKPGDKIKIKFRSPPFKIGDIVTRVEIGGIEVPRADIKPWKLDKDLEVEIVVPKVGAGNKIVKVNASPAKAESKPSRVPDGPQENVRRWGNGRIEIEE